MKSAVDTHTIQELRCGWIGIDNSSKTVVLSPDPNTHCLVFLLRTVTHLKSYHVSWPSFLSSPKLPQTWWCCGSDIRQGCVQASHEHICMEKVVFQFQSFLPVFDIEMSDTQFYCWLQMGFFQILLVFLVLPHSFPTSTYSEASSPEHRSLESFE